MKHILFLTAAFITISIGVKGQDTSLLKRVPYTLKIDVDKDNFYQDEVGATPYVLPDKTIQIYPGETIYAEVTEENGEVKSITAVKEITNPERTLTISFKQTSENKVHQMMMLKIENPFPKNLHYTAMMFLLKQNKWAKTTVFPIEAKLAAYESWSDIIITLGLSNWKFTDN